MTDDHSTESAETAVSTASEPAAPDPLFDQSELTQFEADDVEAGRAITKMLSLFFLYTVIAMSIVGLWTFCAVDGGSNSFSGPVQAQH